MPASGLRLRGAVSSKEHNHEVSGHSDTDRVRNLDLPTSTGSTIAAALDRDVNADARTDANAEDVRGPR